MTALAVLLLAGGCDPYAGWPEAFAVFPYVYTPQADLQDWEQVRWETETWTQSDQQEAGYYLRKLMLHRTGAPAEVLAHFEAQRPWIPPLGQGIRLSFVGDVMYVGGNWSAFAQGAAKLLDGDLRVGNLETPTSKDHATDAMSLGLYSFNAPVQILDALPLDLLQLTNNHSLDTGDLGLENTLAEVSSRGYKQTGVDSQATLSVGGKRVAFLAYTWGLNDKKRSAKGHELHIIPFGHVQDGLGATDLGLLERQVGQARAAGADLVVLLLHWGFEFEYYPDPHLMVLARRMVAAGADLVVGQGPHVVQPAELCHVNRPEHPPGLGACSVRSDDGRERTAAVLYSLGDYGTTLPTTAQKAGLAATVSLGEAGVTGLGWAGVYSETLAGVKGQKVRPLAEAAADYPVLGDEIKRLARHLGEGWRRK